MNTEQQFDLSGGMFSNNVVETEAPKKKAGKKTKTTSRRQLRKDAQAAGTVIKSRARRTRVAAIAIDASQILGAVANMSKKDLVAFQAILAALNPLPRPARKRIIAAIVSVTGNAA